MAVPRPDGMAFDHWRYRLEPRVQGIRGRAAVPVYGAALELRIDAVGKIVSYQARWRPLSGRRIRRPFRPFVPPPPPEGSHRTHEEGALRSSLAYYQEGDAIPQVHLSAYHMVNVGHVWTAVSASDMSLVIDFVPKAIPDGIEVWAVVSGSGDRVQFAFASRPADDPTADVVDLGVHEGRTFEAENAPAVVACKVTLPVGTHVLMVNVEDRATGAFKHYAEMIANAPIADADAPAVA
jgi:hypothetical protein